MVDKTLTKSQINNILKIFENYNFQGIPKHLIPKMFSDYKNNRNLINIIVREEWWNDKKGTKEGFIEKYTIRNKNAFTEDGNINERISSSVFNAFERIINDKIDEDIVDDDDDFVSQSIHKVSNYIQKKKRRNDIEKIKKQINILKSYDKDTYIVDESVNLNDIAELNNEVIDFKIRPNPFIRETYLEKTSDIINITKKSFVKKQISVKRLISQTNLYTNYEIRCPDNTCPKKSLEFTPNQLNSTIFCNNHYTETAKGRKPKPIRLDKTGFMRPTKSIFLYIYEAEVEGDKEGFKFYIYSKDKLDYSKYMMELVVENIKLEYGSKPVTILFVLSYDEIKPEKLQEELIKRNTEEQLEFERKHGLPEGTKIGAIRQALVNINKDYGNQTVDDRGALYQLCTIISSIAYHFYGLRIFNISLIGTTSVAKTYIAERFGPLLDKKYTYISNGDNITEAGLKGGKVDENINGKIQQIFREGLVTVAGLCVIDEAKNFYRPDKPLNDYIKNVLSNEISLAKAISGSGVVQQNFVVTLLSNWLIEFDEEYRKSVKEKYKALIRLNGPVNDIEIEKMFINLNIYLDLDKYDDDIDLKDAIGFTRNAYQDKHIDWRTGSRLESMNRVLFDICVYEEDDETDYKVGYTSIIPPDPRFMPRDEFQEELGKLIRKIKMGDQEFNKQFENLKKSISEWIHPDNNEGDIRIRGSDIFYFYADGKKYIDPKINGLMYWYIIVVSYTEEEHSHTLSDRVKQFCKAMLMRFKKVITRREYDMLEHNLEYTPYDVDENKAKVLSSLEHQKEEEIIEKAMRRLEKEESKDDIGDFMNLDDEKEGEGIDFDNIK